MFLSIFCGHHLKVTQESLALNSLYIFIYTYVCFVFVFFLQNESTLITQQLSMKAIHICKMTAKGSRSFTGTGHA